MSTITIKRNGETMKYSQITAELLRQIITTKFPTAGVAGAAVKMANKGQAGPTNEEGDLLPEAVALGETFVTALLTGGEASDVYEVYVTDGKVEEFEGKSTRGRMAEKVRFALHPELWASDLPVKTAGEKVAKDKGIPDLESL